jgi:hypothetical protein
MNSRAKNLFFVTTAWKYISVFDRNVLSLRRNMIDNSQGLKKIRPHCQRPPQLAASFVSVCRFGSAVRFAG